MKRNGLLAIVALVGCGMAWGATREVAVVPPTMTLVPQGDYAMLRGEALMWPLAPVGAPALPYQVVTLEVAAGAEVNAVTLTGEWQTLAEGVTLEPIQPVCVVGESAPRVAPDAAQYAQPWPAEAVEVLGTTRSLGKALLQLKVTPVRYAQGNVEVLRKGQVRVTLTEPATARVAAVADLAADVPARRYLLISPPAYTTQWQAYLTMREAQRTDVTFVLKDAAEIYRDYPFDATYTDGRPRNPAESIHQFLREDVAAHPAGTTYVVLGGSWVDAWSITSSTDTRLKTKMPGIIAKAAQYYSQYPLSDLFYACLDLVGRYPWDANGDKNYADSRELGNNANDYYPDIVVSRVPLRSDRLNEADVIVAFTEKMRRAEAPDFAGRHIYASAGGELDTTYTATSGYFMRDEQTFYDGGLNQFDPQRPSTFVDCEVVPRRTLKNRLAKRRPIFGGNPLFPNSWGADYATQAEAVTGFFATSRDYTEYRDHGSSTYLYGGYVTVDRYLAASGLSRMIVAGYSCMTGCIDNEKLTLAEAEIVSEQGGTVASVHNTRFGLSYAGRGAEDVDNLSSSLQYSIKKELMDNDCDLGTAWLNSRRNYCGNAGGQARFVMLEQILLGDPLMALRPAVLASTWRGTEDTTENLGYTTLTVPGGSTLASDHLIKVMQGVTVTGAGDLTFAADGGVGAGVTFVEAGDLKLTLASPTQAYFARPIGATEVEIAGSGITLDLSDAMPTFTKLTLDGGTTHQKANVIRGTKAGQLAALLPFTVKNTEVLFATQDAFLGAGEGATLTISHGSAGFLSNSNVGRKYGLWDGFYCPVALDHGSLVVDTTQTAAFGHAEAPGLAISVAGDSAVRSVRGGKFTLFGTTTFTVAPAATLDLAATFACATAESGIVIENQGQVKISGADGLCGEVTLHGGTLQLTALPLAKVTKLTLTGDVKLILPKDDGGFYQILNSQGATLETSGATITVATDDAPEVAIAGTFTTTNAFFDQSAFLVWNADVGTWNTATDNQPWLRRGSAAAYGVGDKAYFPDRAAVDPTITLGEEIVCDFVNFGNRTSRYVFEGQRLSVASLQLGTEVVFNNPVYSSSGVLATGGETIFADLSTPSLDIAAGATIAADTLGNTVSTIRGIRFYPRKMKNSGNVCSLTGLCFYSGSTEVKISTATKSDAPGYSSTNASYLWDGITSGAQMAFGSELIWQVTVESAATFANDQYYLQFMFDSAQPMITHYKLAGGYLTDPNAPTSFRVDVSPDGVSWITVSEVTGARPAGKGFGELWYLSGEPKCSVGSSATAVSIAEGGAYQLTGSPTATFTCAAGARFVAVQGAQLQYRAGCNFVYPEAGTIQIDPSALTLAEGATAKLIANAGKVFTHADLAHFTAPEGYRLTRSDDGLSITRTATVAGPYRRTLSGYATWEAEGWTADTQPDGGAWDGSMREPCGDVEILTTADTALRITANLTFGTLRRQAPPVGADSAAYAHRLRLEKVDGVTVDAVTYDLSAFDERVTIAFSTGAATVIAGSDTRLRENGTGELIVGEGMTVTLYFPEAWQGPITNNGGTIRHRSPQPAPQILFR